MVDRRIGRIRQGHKTNIELTKSMVIGIEVDAKELKAPASYVSINIGAIMAKVFQETGQMLPKLEALQWFLESYGADLAVGFAVQNLKDYTLLKAMVRNLGIKIGSATVKMQPANSDETKKFSNWQHYSAADIDQLTSQAHTDIAEVVRQLYYDNVHVEYVSSIL